MHSPNSSASHRSITISTFAADSSSLTRRALARYRLWRKKGESFCIVGDENKRIFFVSFTGRRALIGVELSQRTLTGS